MGGRFVESFINCWSYVVIPFRASSTAERDKINGNGLPLNEEMTIISRGISFWVAMKSI